MSRLWHLLVLLKEEIKIENPVKSENRPDRLYVFLKDGVIDRDHGNWLSFKKHNPPHEPKVGADVTLNKFCQ